MRTRSACVLASIFAALALSGCEQPAPTAAPSAAATAAPSPPPDLRPFIGRSYTDLITAPETRRYSATELDLSAEARTRFARAMSLSAPAWVAEGGGLSALIFVGCQAGACPDAAGILAIDLENGAVYAAVRDGAGRSVLISNDRLEALVEATSPADLWDDPEAWAEGAPT